MPKAFSPPTRRSHHTNEVAEKAWLPGPDSNQRPTG
jgi:hypothetical protein